IKQMTDSELEKQYKEHIKVFKDIVFDQISVKAYKTLNNILDNISLLNISHEQQVKLEILLKKNTAGQIADDVRAIAEEHIIRSLYKLAHIQYLIMERTGDYGILGEQRVSISFCRLQRNIPSDRDVTQYDADSFRRHVVESRNNILSLSLQELEFRVNNYEINIMGKSFNLNQMDAVNNVLNVLGSNKKIFTRYSAQRRNFIFGNITVRKKGLYKIFVFDTEDIRSPYLPLSIVAGTTMPKIMIRRQSCETIFFNKWQRALEYSVNERKRLFESLENNIGETLKAHAIKKYNVSTAEELSREQKLFVDEILEGVLWHEFGHVIVKDSVFSPRYRALNDVFHSYEDPLSTIIGEFLADWAPQDKSIQGPLTSFINLAENPDTLKKAQRMIYVYLSDNWFLSPDEQENILTGQTDILVAILLPYFKKDKFDFTKFSKEKEKLFNKVLELYTKTIDHIIQPIYQARFNDKSGECSFVDLDLAMRELMETPERKKKWEKDGEYGYEHYYWANMLGRTERHAPEYFKKVMKLLDESLIDFKTNLLEILVGPGNTAKYNHNLRTYLIEKMKELGFYTPVEPISNEEAVNMAIDETYIPYSSQDDVKGWFKAILDGKALIIAIDYPTEPVPALMVLQEMLVRGGVGNIMDGMFLEVHKTMFSVKALQQHEKIIEMKIKDKTAVPLTEQDKQKKADLVDQINKLKNYIDERSILRIKNLKVNIHYGTEDDVRHIASTTILDDGFTLADKIYSYEEASLPSKRVFEVYLPLERGYFDWNTVQAVWRINQQLRPLDNNKEWLLDKTVLEAIIKGYLNSY
ncbi:MAG: hypothetical protein ABIH39_08695, partial [Candidatus Margulisiibacteriota bacterium]